MSHTLEQAYNVGFDDGHLIGIHTNPFDKQQETDLWLSYKMGFKKGQALFFAEESVEYPNEEGT